MSRPRSLRTQLTLFPFLFGTIAVLSLAAAYYAATRGGHVDEVGAELSELATSTANGLDHLLRTEIRVVATLARDSELADAIETDRERLVNLSPPERQRLIDAIDHRWRQADTDDAQVIARYLASPAARRLTQHLEAFPNIYGELFLTDRFGALVGATGRLTTFAHGQKSWWRASYADGSGQVFLDDRGYDASVAEPVLGIVVPVYRGERVIGVLKANLLLRDLLRATIARGSDAGNAAVAVVRSKGAILMENGAEPLSTSLSSHEVTLMQDRASYVDITTGPVHALATAFAPIALTLGTQGVGFGGTLASLDHKHGNDGEYWGILAEREVGLSGIFGRSPWLLALSVGSALLVVALISGAIGHRLARPIGQVAEALARFEQDAFVPTLPKKGPREVQALSEAFGEMAKRIGEQTTSIEHLRAEVALREAAEAAAREALEQVEQAFEKSLQLEKLSALGTFVGGIAHEINNPLMGLTNFIAHVQAHIDDPELADVLEQAQEQVRRIGRTVDRVLRYGRAGSGQLRPIDIHGLVSDARLLLKPELDRWGVNLEVDISDPPPRIVSDRDLLSQAMVNLLLNAIHAVKEEQVREIHIQVRPIARGSTAITVEDTGRGVPESLRTRIFDPFFTTKPPGGGTGLGLSVTLRALAEVGASLALDRAYRNGARFVIELPEDPLSPSNLAPTRAPTSKTIEPQSCPRG